MIALKYDGLLVVAVRLVASYEFGELVFFFGAVIVFDDRRFPLRATDRIENCRTKRQNGPSIDYSKLGGPSHVQ